MKRPTLIDLGTAACGTTFPGGALRIRKQLPDNSLVSEPLDHLTFTAYWRRTSDSGTLVKQEDLELANPDTVVLPAFSLFNVADNYFLTIFSTSEGGDKFEIYRGKISLSASPALP